MKIRSTGRWEQEKEAIVSFVWGCHTYWVVRDDFNKGFRVEYSGDFEEVLEVTNPRRLSYKEMKLK